MKLNTILMLALTATLLTGCAGTAPIHNVNQSLSQRYTDNQMKVAIIEAGIGRKWVMTPVAPGILNGRLSSAVSPPIFALLIPIKAIAFSTLAAKI